MGRGKRSFESYPKEHDSVKQAREKQRKNSSKVDQKICSITHPSSSLIIQLTFRDATTSFLAKWRLRNERRNSIRHYPDRGSASDWLKQNFLPIRSRSDTSSVWNLCALLFKRHFLRKPVMASRNVSCFLRVLATRTTFSIILPPWECSRH